MTKEEYHDLILAIVGGQEPVGMEAVSERRKLEARVIAAISDNYWVYSFLGDAVHQFYLDSLRAIAPRLLSAHLSRNIELFVHWHVVSFQRYYAAFDLFHRGYYFESSSLARSLWEAALTMAGLRREIVTIDDVFGGPIGDEEVSARGLRNRMMRIDQRIQGALLWRNEALSSEARHAVEVFLGLMHGAIHKSKLALVLNLRIARQGGSVPLMPRFDGKSTEVTANILFLSTWCLITTVSYLDGLLPEPGAAWWDRYSKLLLAFEEGIGRGPSVAVKGFHEVVKSVFRSA